MTSLFRQIADDWRANGKDWTKPGFRALATHRFGVWRMSVKPKMLRAPLSVVYRILFRRCRNVYGIELPYTVKLGRGVIIEHQGGIVIHGASVIGDRCVIRQGCTLGIRNMADIGAAPVLEADVELGAGSAILGRITVGTRARVGANAVVLDSVPSGALAIGIPATIHPARTTLSG